MGTSTLSKILTVKEVNLVYFFFFLAQSTQSTQWTITMVHCVHRYGDSVPTMPHIALLSLFKYEVILIVCV